MISAHTVTTIVQTEIISSYNSEHISSQMKSPLPLKKTKHHQQQIKLKTKIMQALTKGGEVLDCVGVR